MKKTNSILEAYASTGTVYIRSRLKISVCFYHVILKLHTLFSLKGSFLDVGLRKNDLRFEGFFYIYIEIIR